MTVKKNGAAKAALFTVPPQLVRADELHERLAYGRDSISRFVDTAVQKVMGMLAKPEVTVNGGRLIAYHATNGSNVIIVENPDKTETVTIDVSIAKHASQHKKVSCEQPLFMLGEDNHALRLRVRLPKEECAVITFA